MSRLYNTFEFIGNIFIPKNKFHEVNTSPSGWEGHRLNFAIQESKTNSVFLEMYAGFSTSKQNTVFSFGKGTENVKGSKLEIPWEDRFKDETLDMVADFKKIVIDLTPDFNLKEEINQLRYEIRTLEYKDELSGDESKKLKDLKVKLKEKAPDRHEFVHEYDALMYLSTVLEDYKNHKFKINGRVEYSESKGKFYRKFKPELIEIVESDTLSKLRATMDVFFTKDALDEKDFKTEKKIYIDGYVMSYDGRAKKDQFFPQQFIINAQKLDLENEKHIKLLNYLRNRFNVKGKGVYHLQWEVNIFRGADKVEFTMNDLTDAQREEVELGISKLEQFAPKGGMLGETSEESRLVKPNLIQYDKENDFREGAVESTYEPDDLIYVAAQLDKKENSVPELEVKDEPKREVNINDELDDLFS